MKEIRILSGRFSWVKRVLNDKRLLTYVEDLMSIQLLKILLEPLGMVIRFLFCNWDSMHMEAFLWSLILFMVIGRASSLYRKESWVVGGEDLDFIYVRLLLPTHLSSNCHLNLSWSRQCKSSDNKNPFCWQLWTVIGKTMVEAQKESN